MLTALLVPAGHNLAGKIICACERDRICHVACDMGDDWSIAEEAVGCWARPSDFYTNPAIIRYPLPLNTAQEAIARSWLRSQVGRRYDYEQLPLDALDLAFRLRLAAHGHAYVCSSLVAQACVIAGVNLFPGRDPLTIMPADFDRLARSGSWGAAA